MRLRWPEFMLGMDPSSRNFTLALCASIVLHGMVLSIHFKLPAIILDKYTPQALEVVLVNSKTRLGPVKADVLAQSNLDGGGNSDERRHPRTPLPALRNTESDAAAKRAARHVEEAEAQQPRMTAQLQATQSAPPTERPDVATAAQPRQPLLSGRDLATSALAIARLEAQISRQIEEQSQRPRRTFIGSRAQEYRFAQYVEDWRLKVERIGNVNYPDGARGRVYGSLVLAVSINADGSLDAVEVRRSSGHQILDRAAERIVKMASPFAGFPDNIKRDTDILVITRTWTFAPGDKLFGE